MFTDSSLRERNSTRVSRTAGGKSSLGFLFGGDASEAAVPRSSNSFASGASQNSGNVITDRPTTRVHHAPGGSSSINIFTWEEKKPAAPAARPAPAPPAPAPVAPVATATPVSEPTPAATAAPSAAPTATADAAAMVHGARPAHVSSNAFASGANQNSGNFITDRPTTRVHHAPGGRTSINIFSWGE